MCVILCDEASFTMFEMETGLKVCRVAHHWLCMCLLVSVRRQEAVFPVIKGCWRSKRA